MSHLPSQTVMKAELPEDVAKCFAIRHTVFVEGQNIDAMIERDDWDNNPKSWHMLALLNGAPAGAVRVIFPDAVTAKIGRLAVLPEARGQGLSRDLMAQILDDLPAHGVKKVKLSAQAYLENFYHTLGFETIGAPYQEVGIDHVLMEKTL
jgi:predicted GNAT family N-acyltransferase